MKTPIAFTALVLLLSGAAAQGQPIAPYKDALFAYRAETASRAGGRILDVPYDEGQDIDRRDAVPERRVQRNYVDLAPQRHERLESWRTSAGTAEVGLVGGSGQPGFVVLFVHGKGGDRSLGLNDWSFGGNFNRLKNLADRNGGLYMTMSAGLFGPADMTRASALVADIARRFPSARIVMACASMGSQVCWSVAGDAQAAPRLSGLVILGGQSRASDLSGALAARQGRDLPILIAHGTRDRVYDAAQQMAIVEGQAARQPSYPIRFVGFDGGTHGTPIRMLDWRDTLNWILSRP